MRPHGIGLNSSGNGKKTVTFARETEDRVEDENARTIGKLPGNRALGMLVAGVDCVWKWAEARGGSQETRMYRDGLEGWYWTSTVGGSRVWSSIEG